MINYTVKFSPEKNLKEAISPYNQYCDGFKSPGGNGKSYISSLILSIGKTPKTFSHKGSIILDSILAYDNAEISSAYIGQINMTIVSSFSGPNGLIWGYDLAKTSNLKKKHHLIPSFLKHKGRKVYIYDVQPLLEASLQLFGSNKKKHFPFLPGAHVPCAGRHLVINGPAHIYSAIGIGIPKNRSKSASLLMEDVGKLNTLGVEKSKKEILKNIAESILIIGKNQEIVFKELFVGLKNKKIGKNEIGCGLVVMPYFTLARKAVVDNNPKKMMKISLRQWKKLSKSFFI